MFEKTTNRKSDKIIQIYYRILIGRRIYQPIYMVRTVIAQKTHTTQCISKASRLLAQGLSSGSILQKTRVYDLLVQIDVSYVGSSDKQVSYG